MRSRRRRPGSIRVGVIVVLAVAVLAAVVALVARPIRTGRVDPADKARVAAGLPRVFVANPVIESMVRALATDGDRLRIYAPWRGDGTTFGDPAYWKPTAEEIREIQSCELILLNGAGYEKWAEQAALPRARTVDTTADIRSRLIVEEGETHSHGPEGEHSHSGFASSTWLSPELAKEQLATVVGRLYELLGSTYPTSEIHDDQRARLDEATAALREVGRLQPKLLASHPVYQYLGRAGGIAIDSMHWEPGEMPADKEWTKFRLLRAGHPRPTAWMLWEGEPGDEIRAKLAAEGVEVFVFPLFPIDPSIPSVDGEFVWHFPRVVEALRVAVGGRAPGG
jgi:zinc transport system substrate-binding protein